MSELRVVHLGLGDNAVEYTRGWEEQRRLHADRVADRIGDTVLLLEHLAVYTAGKRTESHERPVDGTPVIDVDRGGKITWHGPGQLVGYPVVKLPDPIDVLAYVRLLEQVLIDACADLGLATTRIDGRSGVWVAADARGPARKVGAIGLRVAGGVSMHGFSLNCDCSLAWSEQIIPCGISDAGTTTLTRELGRPVSVAAALPVVEEHLRAALEAYSTASSTVFDSKVSPGFRKGTKASTTACA